MNLEKTIEHLTGRGATRAEYGRFGQYLDLLLTWNRTQRLTGVRTPHEIVKTLFEDSLLFLSRVPPGPLVMADIGAGAGIPGVPLAIVRPDISVTLIEARRKRVSFLRALKRELAMPNIDVLEGRAESLVRESTELTGKFDVVVTRGVGSLPDLLPAVMEYLLVGGVFIASGPPAQKVPLPSAVGHGVRREAVQFPGLGISRTFLLAFKEG